MQRHSSPQLCFVITTNLNTGKPTVTHTSWGTDFSIAFEKTEKCLTDVTLRATVVITVNMRPFNGLSAFVSVKKLADKRQNETLLFISPGP